MGEREQKTGGNNSTTSKERKEHKRDRRRTINDVKGMKHDGRKDAEKKNGKKRNTDGNQERWDEGRKKMRRTHTRNKGYKSRTL